MAVIIGDASDKVANIEHLLTNWLDDNASRFLARIDGLIGREAS